MKVRVANLKQPGQPIVFNYDGKNYEIEDREVVDLPGKVVKHLMEDCIEKTYEQKEIIGKDGQPKVIDYPVEVPRFSVSPVHREYVNIDLKGNESKADKNENKA